MKRRLIGKLSATILFFILFICSLTFAADKDIVGTQGIILAIDLAHRSMVVNERKVAWDEQTLFNNEKGKPITVDQLKVENWVYLEGVRDKGKKRVLARKIYLLPKHIDEKQKHLYPFIR